MTLEEDLVRSGADFVPGEPPIAVRSLIRRARRGRILARGGMALLLVTATAVAIRTVNDQAEEEVGVAGQPHSASAGTVEVFAADGTALGSVPAGPAASSDPVMARVVEELLDDPVIADRLAAVGISGSRGSRLDELTGTALSVTTAIVPQLQAAATDAATAGAQRESWEVALVAAAYDTGEIQAVTGPAGRVRGQAGSVILPITMLAALEAGVSPAEQLPAPASLSVDIPGQGEWRVTNYGDADHGELTLGEAVSTSAMTPWAGLVASGRLSPDQMAASAGRIGLEGLPANPATLLGGADVSPYELAGAFAAVTNLGDRMPLHLVTSIRLSGGASIYDSSARFRPEPVTNRAHAAAVRQALHDEECCEGAGEAAGLGDSARRLGKSGLSQDRWSSWFAGSSPEITTVVWTGSVDGAIDTVPVRTAASAEIWKDFTDRADEVLARRTFPTP